MTSTDYCSTVSDHQSSQFLYRWRRRIWQVFRVREIQLFLINDIGGDYHNVKGGHWNVYGREKL